MSYERLAKIELLFAIADKSSFKKKISERKTATLRSVAVLNCNPQNLGTR